MGMTRCADGVVGPFDFVEKNMAPLGESRHIRATIVFNCAILPCHLHQTYYRVSKRPSSWTFAGPCYATAQHSEHVRAQVPEPSLKAQLTALHELACACVALFIN